MTDATDPLARLISDRVELNREQLASLLDRRISLHPGDAKFSFLPNTRSALGNRRTVLLALLAQKALHLLDSEIPEGTAPKGLEDTTGIRGGTLRPILKQLTDDGITRRVRGSYIVPDVVLGDVARELEKAR